MGVLPQQYVLHGYDPITGRYLNASADINQLASDACEDVYEKQGADAFNKCRENYIKNQGSQSTLGNILGIFDKGLDVIRTRQQTKAGGTTIYVPQDTPPKSNTIWWVVGGIAVVGLGIGAYYMFRNKKA
jgi:hypothetical protein